MKHKEVVQGKNRIAELFWFLAKYGDAVALILLSVIAVDMSRRADASWIVSVSMGGINATLPVMFAE